MANLCPGDVILAIEGIPAMDMLHCEAQNKIKESTHQLCLTIERLYAETKKACAKTGGGPSKPRQHLHSRMKLNTSALH